MKLIVQIPALNEGKTIGAVIANIPRTIPGVDQVEVLVVDDGCSDDTVQVAQRAGADYIVRHTANKGLANAYQTGIDMALRMGADIIVNTDADHQYPGEEIPRLVAPIIEGRADIVVGDRQVQQLEHFSLLKKGLQHLGSSVVRWASETDVPDTVSGFRALSRDAALRTFVTTDFSYTVEALIQAGKRRLTVVAVPISTNYVERPSRLHRGNWNFIKRQAAIIARTYATYEPLKVFSYIALVFLLPGLLLLGRAAYVFIGRRMAYVTADNMQALVAGGILVLMALIIFLIGLVADLVGGVRRIQQETLYRVRTIQVEDEAWRRTASARLDALEQATSNEALISERNEGRR
ncbi:glycosyltransferase family 2 protein [Candidatus Viridilinea mediisalina]|uniref:Glycosyl transferase n=1 Tax=Candidatus Viridilinea mediisalina TaxID=2024553 RepID=A0A2A6RF68_9CHLR|nr:glycosyltransferase family 2 protein [Candidatus Viridilinea mediisalina]PDW01727.1 glycosyl transferase [Candidatus Viridilinea mediisalina]